VASGQAPVWDQSCQTLIRYGSESLTSRSCLILPELNTISGDVSVQFPREAKVLPEVVHMAIASSLIYPSEIYGRRQVNEAELKYNVAGTAIDQPQ
jgi:hypothetical protein